MADIIKSFDELYKVVTGEDPPKKADPVKPSNKVKNDLLTDPSKGRKSYGSGQKNKTSKSPGYSKKRKQKEAVSNKKKKSYNQSRKRAQELRQYKQSLAEKGVTAREKSAKDNLKPMGSAIRCPVHGNMLIKGTSAVFENSDKIIKLYFCKDCRCFYYPSSKTAPKRTVTLNDYEVRYIHAPSFSSNYAKQATDTLSVRRKFDDCTESSGIILLKTGEPAVQVCPECQEDISNNYDKTIVTINFIDNSTRDISGSFCNRCGAAVISTDRLRSLERYCNADYIASVSTKSRKVVSQDVIRNIQERFNPNTTTLYVHQGKVRCLIQEHNVISIALRIPSCVKSNTVVINANYCFDCDRFFISEDEYEYYRSIYPIMLIKFEYLSDSDNIGRNLADKSPLMLSGYTVRASSNYTEIQRHMILKNIIELGVLKKHEVINYLNYFISMNGKASGMDAAVKKMEGRLGICKKS